MIVHVISLTEERKVKTVVIPFSAIGNVEFEYEVVNGEDREEMCIHFNNNCSSLTISDLEIEHLCIRFIGFEGMDINKEVVTIKSFEKELIKAMNYVLNSKTKS